MNCKLFINRRAFSVEKQGKNDIIIKLTFRKGEKLWHTYIKHRAHALQKSN